MATLPLLLLHPQLTMVWRSLVTLVFGNSRGPWPGLVVRQQHGPVRAGFATIERVAPLGTELVLEVEKFRLFGFLQKDVQSDGPNLLTQDVAQARPDIGRVSHHRGLDLVVEEREDPGSSHGGVAPVSWRNLQVIDPVVLSQKLVQKITPWPSKIFLDTHEV